MIRRRSWNIRCLKWDFLAQLAELEEASRKVNWSVRYEPKGTEQNTW
jgi:hypothetical protein